MIREFLRDNSIKTYNNSYKKGCVCIIRQPATVLSALYTSFLTLPRALWGREYCSHFTRKDTEASAGIPISARPARQNLGCLMQLLGNIASMGELILRPESSIPTNLCLLSSECSLPHYLSELKLEAVTITSSLLCTNTGIFRQPGDFSKRCNSFRVS